MNDIVSDIKKDKVKLISSLILFSLLIIGFTYALIGAIINLDDTDITAKIGSRPVFTADSTDQIILNIPYVGVESDNEYVIAHDTGSVNMSLTTGYNSAVTCSYDLYWVWDSTSDTTKQYKKTIGANKEYTISGIVNNSTIFSDIQLNDYDASNLKTKLYTGNISVEPGEISYLTWVMKANFYKTEAIQTSHQGSSYTGTVQVENIVCEKKQGTLSGVVSSLVSNNDYTSSQDSTIYKVAQETVEYNSETLDAGIRYEGKNPDNYVTFNNEEWRIIGTFEGSTIGLEPGKQYTKIIKATSIGEFAWDCDDQNGDGDCYDAGDYENDWATSTLKEYLNGEYLNTLSNENMVANATWYLKALNEDDGIYELNGGYTPQWYLGERYTGKAGSVNNVRFTAATETKAAIGLMYPSDYGYAAYGTKCDNKTTEVFGWYEICAAVDWLAGATMSEWLISPDPGLEGDPIYYYVNSIYDFGNYIGGGDTPTIKMHTRPTLYLEHNVQVVGGDGSKENPYTLTSLNTLSDTVISQESDLDYSSGQDGTIYKVAHETVEYNGNTLDAGIRYEGKDPDNYVTFNNEEWRIIGTFEGSTIGLAPGKQYTKIIKATSIGDYAWDCDDKNNDGDCSDSGESENDWENATLNAYLNGEYLSGLGDASKIAKYNNNYSTWYLKGLDYNTHTGENAYTPDWYLGERYTGYTGYKDGVKYGAKSEINAAIGLMYPSDYGYAAYGAECDNKSSMTLYHYNEGCVAVDWLAQALLNNNYEWLMSSYPGTSVDAFIVGGSGGFVTYGHDVYYKVAARPTLYLSDEVLVSSGSGTKNNPYKLTMASEPTLSETILAQASEDDYTSSQDGTIYKVAHETVEYNGQTLDAGVRYEGKDPDNYITFNGNEEWRIIGVFEGSTIGLEPGKQYTKIIKSISLGEFAWDYDEGEYENDWENATLNAYLNGEYLNGLSDASKIAKYNNNYSTWYLKGLDDETYLGENSYTPEWYLGERYTGYTGYKDGVQYGAKSEIQAAIGLTYPSDYGYAAYGTECDNKSSMKLVNYNGGCAAVDWLAQDSLDSHSEWLISLFPGLSDGVFVVNGYYGGYVASSNDLLGGFAARPTLYIEANLTATGTGTKLDPYVLK